MAAPGQRPLSELSPVAQRRNSPSWNQNTKTMVGGDSSPFNSSPMHNNSNNNSGSWHHFWQDRDTASSPLRPGSENKSPYDPEFPRSPSKRASVERLKRASRVKTSTLMFSSDKRENDLTEDQPMERPLVGSRQMSLIPCSSANPGDDARRQLPSQLRPASSLGISYNNSGFPSRNQQTPTKSSLNKNGRYSRGFDPSMDIYSDDDTGPIDASQLERSPHRHNKSVTFDAAPPQINEYEMTTPVPSTVASSPREGSFDSYDEEDSYGHDVPLVDDSFDASLEDTDKTPVVLPEDWRFMSHDDDHDDSGHDEDDPFYDDYDTPDPDDTPGSVQEPKPLRPRVESMDSNGEHRPLPPLPGAGAQFSPNSSVMSAFERGSNSDRAMPSPLRPASFSKSDIAGFGTSSMSLEDRLRFMATHDHDDGQTEAEKQRERRLRRGNAKERSTSREGDGAMSYTSEGSERELSPDILATPPHISRESILRGLKKDDTDAHDTSDMSDSMRSPSPLPLDPDVPIPSLESDDYAGHDEFSIKDNHDENDIDIYDIPQYNMDERGNSPGEFSGDDGSRYSRDEDEDGHDFHPSDVHSDGQSTPVADPDSGARAASPANERLDASSVSSIGIDHEDIQTHVERSISPVEIPSAIAPRIDLESIRSSLQRPETPEQNNEEPGDDEQTEDAPDSPQSVIRHSVSHSPEPDVIPAPAATVKAPGAMTRPSLTPADMETMAATRRKVSSQELPPPQTQEQDDEGESTFVAGGDSQLTIEAPTDDETEAEAGKYNPPVQEKRVASLVKLDVPVSTSEEESLGFGLDEEFDRVIEAQKVAFEYSLSQLSYNSELEQQVPAEKSVNDLTPHPQRQPRNDNRADTTPTKQRGYLMRQNTKVIVATNRPEPPAPRTDGQPDARAPGQVSVSPRKASQPTWTTEPWNPKGRRQSIKMTGAAARKKASAEVVPPMPGYESNVKDVAPEQIDEEYEDGQERGRVFVKVVGVKNLDLPLPRTERSFFSLTLDNGLHCVTTSWLELGKSAPIGQEFELVVLNDLEFQLTLQMKLDPPKPKVQPAAPQPKPQKPQKTSAFSRVFASPKKRREMELKQQLEAQKQQKVEEMNQVAPHDPWHKVRNLVAPDGSFARAYVSLTDYENNAYGRPSIVDVTCFNEWAVDEVMNSVKSKRSAAGPAIQRRPPYHVGALELQLLYVPKPKGATDDDMPKSMNACIREMREADNAMVRSWEGFLSQQGGDCPFWRRRYFKLQGSKLTAFHETTRQPRATINLAKAAKLIDDKSILTQKETSTKGGRRRKSAFAEEEEGYMFVEEGFRIRFGNGEVIDFYADSASDKDGWMKVFEETVGKGSSSGSKNKAWTEMVLKRERNNAAKKQPGDRQMSKPMRPSAPPPTAPQQIPPPPPAKEPYPMAPPPKPRHQHHKSQQPDVKPQNAARHQKTRSMIF